MCDRFEGKYGACVRRAGVGEPDRCGALVRATAAVQGPCSAGCGLCSALVVASVDRYHTRPMAGNPIIDTVVGVKHAKMYKPEFREILHRNQERMYYWFMKENPYFRAHEEELKRETALDTVPTNHERH